MPAQLPDRLVNDHPQVDFGTLQLFAIVRGRRRARPRWDNQYPFIHPPRPSKEAVHPRLWRGYVAQYRLRPDGSLVLESYQYPFDPLQPDETLHEVLEGDFWLLMKATFFGDCTYIPFRQGRIETDRALWERDVCDLATTEQRPRGGRWRLL